MIFVWYIPFYLQTWLLWMLVRRHTYRIFPNFFTYTAFGVVACAARFVTHNYAQAYFWTYWLTDAVYILLGTLTLFEVFHRVLGNFARIGWRFLLFADIVAASIFLSLARMQAIPPRLEGTRLWIVTAEIAVRFAQVITFATLVSLVPLLGLRWQRQSRGIAAGFGMYATVMLLMTTKFSDMGTRFMPWWSSISLVAYSAALMIWLWSFLRSQGLETTAQENSSVANSSPSCPGVYPINRDSKKRERLRDFNSKTPPDSEISPQRVQPITNYPAAV